MKTAFIAAALLMALCAHAETAMPVPSDPKATYTILEKTKTGSNVILLTKRVGPSGTSYARREVDCGKGLSRYIGEGDTIAEAKQAKNPPAKFNLPVAESISGYATRAACLQ